MSLFALVCSPLFAGPLSGPRWAHEVTGERPSPRVTYGQLENGLRYAIYPNGMANQLVSLRLYVAAGSLCEREDELGYAHLVEHAAFFGTRNFKAHEIIEIFQKEGLAFGTDATGAVTQADSIYKVDLPQNSIESVSRMLSVLRDFADGVLFVPAEVERERAVVLSEALATRSEQSEKIEAITQAFCAGTLLAKRPPLGTEATLQNATPERLRAFYDAWYRPERMVVIITGAISVEVAETLIREKFSDLSARAPARPAPELGEPVRNHSGVPIVSIVPSRISSNVRMLFGSNYRSLPFTRGDLQPNVMGDFAIKLLAAHMNDVIARGGSGAEEFDAAQAITWDSFIGNTAEITATKGSRWEDALAIFGRELRRVQEYGFKPSDLEKLRDRTLKLCRNDAANVEMIVRPMQMAELLIEALQARYEFHAPDELLAVREERLQAITMEDCRQWLRDAWPAGPEQIVVMVPRGVDITASAVQEAWRRSCDLPIEPLVDQGLPVFAYTDFGVPGEVVYRSNIANPEITLVRFANGVRLNIKPDHRIKEQTKMIFRFGHGRLDEPPDKPGLSIMALYGTVFGGLKRQSFEDWRKTLQHVTDRTLTWDSTVFKFVASGEAAAVNEFLPVCAALVSDSAFDARVEDDARAMVTNWLENNLGMEQMYAQSRLYGSEPCFVRPRLPQAASYTMDDVRAWMPTQMNPADMSFSVIGDVQVDEVIAMAARTLGALPAGASTMPVAARLDPAKLGPPPTPQAVHETYVGENRSTQVTIYWLLRDHSMDGDTAVPELLAKILGDRIEANIRSKDGSAYIAGAGLGWGDFAPQLVFVRGIVICEAERAPEIAAKMKSIASELARGGVLSEELAAARDTLRYQWAKQFEDFDFWVDDMLPFLQTKPEKVDQILWKEVRLGMAMRTSVNSLAASCLTDENAIEIIIEPVAPKQ